MGEYFDKDKMWFRVWCYLGLGAAALVFIFAASAFIYLPQLHFQDLKIEGAERVNSEDIARALIARVSAPFFARYIGSMSMLLWSAGEVSINNPLVQGINIERNFWDRSIVAIVKEREHYAIWCDVSSECVWVDKSGLAIERAPVTEGQLVNIVHSNGGGFRLGEQVLPQTEFLYLSKVLNGLSVANIAVADFEYDASALELVAKTVTGVELFFSLRFDPALTISPLSTLVARPDFRRLGYVDFRMENRVYYK